jgi:hypothetical protein
MKMLAWPGESAPMRQPRTAFAPLSRLSAWSIGWRALEERFSRN